jgi:sterol desaturase/sphingolipid hydroxylase (fatty acid hydroxylase superfamily)
VDIGVDRDFPVLPNGNDSSSDDVARPNVISPVSWPSRHRRKVIQKSFIYPPQELRRKSVVSEYYLNEEANNTPFFLIPVTLVISLGYLFLPLDLFIVQLTAMSISFHVHLYFDKHYHVAGSWLGRFAWFRRKQQLHFLHHRHADCNFAVVDNFWDWLLGTYRSIDARRET